MTKMYLYRTKGLSVKVHNDKPYPNILQNDVPLADKGTVREGT